MMDPDDFVFLISAKSMIQAQTLASLLESHSIRAHVPGVNLSDEWASFSQMSQGLGTQLHVPRCDLAKAQAILEKAREAASNLSQPSTPDDDSNSRE